MANARKWLSTMLAIVMLTSCFSGIGLAEEADVGSGDNNQVVVTETEGSETEENQTETALTAITISQSSVELTVGETQKLSVAPNEGATLPAVTWTSSDETVATVSSDGEVTAVKSGNATITASCEGVSSVSCAVTVVEEAKTEVTISVSPATAELTVGGTAVLTASLSEGADASQVTWSSSNEAVATVEGGTVQAVGAGEAVITAAYENVSATCTVTVKEEEKPELTSITVTPETEKLLVGETVELKVAPNEGAELGEVTWESDDEEVATVDDKGLVTAVKAGTAKITAKCGDLSAVCTVTVNAELEEITLSAEAAEVMLDKSIALTVSPNEGAELGEVTWKSGDETIVTVDNGVVTAVGVGETVVTATCGDLSASCTITVKDVLKSIVVQPSATEVTVGSTVTLTVSPNAGAELSGPVTWSTSDEAIATVDNGVVTGVSRGTAVITAKCGEFTASCEVSVFVPLTSLGLDKTSALMDVDAQLQLNALANQGASVTGATWTSSNPAVATVDAKGVVTALSVGKTTITVKCGEFTAQCAIEVQVLADNVALHTPKLVLYPNQKGTIRYALEPANVTNPTVTWVTSDSSVATVNSAGVVTGVAQGTCVITGTTSNGVIVNVPVTIVAKGKAVTSVRLNSTKLTLQRTQTKKIKASVSPSKAADKSITWVSTNPNVASVSSDGTITAVSAGKATIIAVASSGVYKSCTVTVKPLAVTKVTLSAKKATVASGETIQLSAVMTPSNADNLTQKWYSSKTSVATVDENGVVTGKKAGSARIYCKASSGKLAYCTVTVKAVSPVMNISKKTVTGGDTFQISISYSPATTQDMGLTWYSSKSSVATVDANGVVTAHKDGKAKIYCKTKYGKTDYCTVTVKPISPVMNVTKKTITTGDTFQIGVSYSPTTSQEMKLTWYSSKSSVATVDANGVVTAYKAGKAKIYCKTQYGKTDYCTVTVKPVVPVMDRAKQTLYVGSSVTIGVKFNPSTAKDTSLVWKSSKSSVATVNEDGTITAVSPGTATITCTAASGKKDSLKVTVKPVLISSVTLTSPYGDFYVGGKYKLDVAYAPENATTQKVKWSSSNKKIAKVNATTGEITCLKAGTVKITATAADGSKKKAVYTITVKAITLTEFALDAESITLNSGETRQIGLTLSANLNITPVWTSDNKLIATVDQDGVVTAIGSGITMIRCSVGSYQRTVKVYVPQNGSSSYRVLIAGEYTSSKSSGYLNFAANGLNGVEDAFDLANIYGDRYEKMCLNNPSEDKLISSIDTFFDDADSDDVSVLFLMSHGLNVNGQYRWRISDSSDYITEAELTQSLEKIEGEVVLVLVSCYSGQYIENYCTSDASASLKGVVSSINGSRPGDKKISVITAVSGNMKGGFTNLPAATSFDFFTMLFNKALGWDQQNKTAFDTMYGDLNEDGVVTLLEIVQYIDANYQKTINEYIDKNGEDSVLNNKVQKLEYYLPSPDLTVYSRAKAKIAS